PPWALSACRRLWPSHYSRPAAPRARKATRPQPMGGGEDSLVVPPINVVGDLEDLRLPFGQVQEFLLNVGITGLFPCIALTVDLGASIHANLHGPNHFELGKLIDELLIRGAGTWARVIPPVLQILLRFLEGIDHLGQRTDDFF